MKQQNPLKPKLFFLVGLFGLILVLFSFELYHDQIVEGDRYLAASAASTASTETVVASRGVITDRNGRLLIGNRLTYTLSFSADPFGGDDAACDQAILRLLSLLEENGLAWEDDFPVSAGIPFEYDASAQEDDDFLAFLAAHKLKGLPAAELVTRLCALYQIDGSSADWTAVRRVLGVRYALERRDPCLLCRDVPVELISRIVDGHFAGARTGTASARVYFTSCAAHILGRVSRIYAEDWDKYRELGYSMDALVGAGGVEEAFESYLHGVNGTRLITTDAATGRITGELYTRDPKPGSTVSLTLDVDFQHSTESALAATIEEMISKDQVPRGGAAAVVKVGSGEVLALASYPTYDLAHFDQIYDQLLADPRAPMFNRAVDGLYAPGSTFKPCTAVAALESGVITPSTTIRDRGIYTYYEYPQPMCWIYQGGGGTHGSLNVTRAITESCNYFFYEVGRLTGIETLDSYAAQFGLGQHTGIEIGDSAGALASEEYALSHDLEWSEGQVITAAIGQSYNLFTPLQLANYVATLVSGGKHYDAHLLKSVYSTDSSSPVYEYDRPPRNVIPISDSTLEAVLSGMHDLTTFGGVSSQFSDCIVSAGAKTGTAQVGTELNNGVFVAFAPYENPEIAVAVVIEKGGAGAALAGTAVSVINAYFAPVPAGDATGENVLLK